MIFHSPASSGSNGSYTQVELSDSNENDATRRIVPLGVCSSGALALEFVPHKAYLGGISRGQTEEYPLVGASERARMNQLRFRIGEDCGEAG